MFIRPHHVVLRGAAMLVAGLCGIEAMAFDEPAVNAVPVRQEVAAAVQPNPLQAKPLDASVLSNKRGGSDVFSDMSLRGVVADNRAINVATGGNLVTQGALAGASGVPMLVQNTGNNVLIQNATIINLQLK